MLRTPANDVLVAAFKGQVFGVEASTGQIRWENDLDFPDEVEIAIEDGVVIAAAPTKLAFLDLPTGHPLAIVKIAGEYGGRATMIVSGGHVFIGRSGEVTCMTLRGQTVWTQKFEGKGFGSVALGFPGNIRQGDDIGSK